MDRLKVAGSRLSLLAGLLTVILYFPLWWYSQGFFRLARRIFSFWQEQAYSLGVVIWLRNIFVPMYGQSDFIGRLISFGVRLVQIIVRTFILLVWLVLCLILILAWLALPILIVWATLIQLAI